MMRELNIHLATFKYESLRVLKMLFNRQTHTDSPLSEHVYISISKICPCPLNHFNSILKSKMKVIHEHEIAERENVSR